MGETKQIDDDVYDPFRAAEDGLPNRHSFLSLSSSPSEPSITDDDTKKFSMRRPLLRTCSFLFILVVVATTATVAFVTKQGGTMSPPSFSLLDHRAKRQQYQTPLSNDTTNRPIFPGKASDSRKEEEEYDHHMIDDDQYIDGSDQDNVVLIGQLYDQDHKNHDDYIHHDKESLKKMDDSYDEKRQINPTDYDHDDESTPSSASFLTVFKNKKINDEHDVDDKRHMQDLSSSSLETSNSQWMSGYSPYSTPRGPTGAFSQEHGGFSPINMLPITGMRCYGKHCDNKTLMYRTFSSGYDIFLSGSSKTYWTSWFSEEGHASGFCATGYLVSRTQCNWKMCDNMRLQCTPIDTSLYQSTGITSTSPYFSEEQSYNTYCPLGYFLNGLRCAGGYCDNVSLSCMKVEYKSDLNI